MRSLFAQLDVGQVNEPNLTVVSSCRIVEEFLIEREIPISNYTVAGISYNFVTAKWMFTFDGTSPLAGEHFAVLFSDVDSKDIELVPGL